MYIYQVLVLNNNRRNIWTTISLLDNDIIHRSKIIKPFIENVSNTTINYFKTTNIDDLYKKVAEKGIDKDKNKKVDFTI